MPRHPLTGSTGFQQNLGPLVDEYGIGTAAVGGMLMGTLWGLVLVPGLYVAFTALTAIISRRLAGSVAVQA